MKILIYILRFLLVLIFLYAGVEKLFIPYNPTVFEANAVGSDPLFFQFYDLLQNAGYLYFVGFFQLLCGVLLILKRTYLIGSIMLTPLILCMLMVHVFLSKNTIYLVFDTFLFLCNTSLILYNLNKIKPVFS